MELSPYGISTTMLVDVPDHEVLIAFTDDVDAEEFCAWFDEEGKKLFEKWYKKSWEVSKGGE